MAGISSNVYSGPYDADGAQTAFPFTFSIATENEAAVEMDGVPVSPDLYRVTFDNAGGTVTFLTPPALHAQILLRSEPDYLQTSSFENEGSYNLDTVNLINRRATIRDLVTKEMADRALKVPPGASAPYLPSLIDSDGMVLAIADGQLRWSCCAGNFGGHGPHPGGSDRQHWSWSGFRELGRAFRRHRRSRRRSGGDRCRWWDAHRPGRRRGRRQCRRISLRRRNTTRLEADRKYSSTRCELERGHGNGGGGVRNKRSRTR